MQRPELVLSSTTSFFFGGIRQTFANAKKYGFKYVEIIPYRWTTPMEILNLEKKYGIEVAGIHLPIWWKQPDSFLKPALLILNFYLGSAAASPSWDIADAFLPRKPYVIFHTNIIRQMADKFAEKTKTLHAVIENIPYEEDPEEFYWNPVAVERDMAKRGLDVGIVFDHGHFNQTREALPSLDLLETYKQFHPEVIHISYNSRGLHLLPNKKEQEELKSLLRLHAPKYISLETYPLVSVKKGKELMDNILNQVFA